MPDPFIQALMAVSLSIDAGSVPCDACVEAEMSDVQTPIIRPSFVAAESSSRVHFTPQPRYNATPLVSSCSRPSIHYVLIKCYIALPP